MALHFVKLFFVLPHFDNACDLLLRRHWQQNGICFLLYNEPIDWLSSTCIIYWKMVTTMISPLIGLLFHYYKKNWLHVFMGLYRNTLERTSKYGKIISDTLRCTCWATFFFLITFWCHLSSITEEMHRKMESICWSLIPQWPPMLCLQSTTAMHCE